MGIPKILVVDDDPDIVETISFGLEEGGYKPYTATNGWEALGAFKIINPDLVILDVMLPKENGYRVSRIIKDEAQAKGKTSRKIPVVLLTARNLEDFPDREKMFIEFSKADSMIYKPFEMDHLLKTVRELLNPK